MHTIATTFLPSLPPKSWMTFSCLRRANSVQLPRPGQKLRSIGKGPRSVCSAQPDLSCQAGAPALLPCARSRGLQHTLRFHAAAWSDHCQQSQIVCHIHFIIWQVGVQNMLQEGSKKFSKSLLGSPSHLLNQALSRPWRPSCHVMLCHWG